MLMNSLQPQFNFCRACQAENRVTANFCRKCGHMLIDKQTLNDRMQVVNKKVADELPDLFYAGIAQATAEVIEVNQEVIVEAVEVAPISEVCTAPRPKQEFEYKSSSFVCPGCTVDVRQSDRFCLWCGHKQAHEPVTSITNCSTCKSPLPAVANFCFSCGVAVNFGRLKSLRVPLDMFADEESELFPRFEA